MKRIYVAILAFAAALTFVPTASAQKNIPYHEKGGVGYNKYIVNDKPDGNGEYLVHLETFTTGEVHVDRKSVPSDIVLVLDLSGSMRYDYRRDDLTLSEQLRQERPKSGDYVEYTYDKAYNVKDLPRKDYTYIENAFGASYIQRYYKDTDGSFYAVKPEKSGSYLRLYFQKGSTKYYLSGSAGDENGGVTTTPPTNVTSSSTIIWRGRLYRYPFRLEVLQEAVNSFIDKIAENDATEVQPYLKPDPQTGITPKGNQISIVRFSGDGAPASSLSFDSNGLVQETASGGGSATFVRKRFTSVNSNENVNALKKAINELSTQGNTPHDSGMRLAELLLQNLEQNGMPAINPVYNTPERLKTVVLFTDGKPEVSGRNAFVITKAATEYAYDIKQNLHGKVFCIGFNASSTDEEFLRYTSSQYPDGLQSSTSAYSYSGQEDTEHVDGNNKSIFYADAGGSDLTKIFESIAEYAGGNNQEYGATSMVAVDIVSTSFQLPVGVDTSRIKVYTAQCLGTLDETFTPEGETQAKNYLAFAEKKEAPTRGTLDSLWISHKVWKLKPDGTPELDANGNKIQAVDADGKPIFNWEKLTNVDIDGANNPGPNNTNGIRLSIDTTDNSLSITGFDFAQCWCGLDAEHENTEDYNSSDPNYQYHKDGYRGFKLIIEFPIKITDDAVGGPNVNTNLPGSGLYMTGADGNKTGNPIILYPQPNLPVPVNLWLQKKGLKKGESVTFTIERRDSSDPDSEYEYFTNVILTGKPGDTPVMEKLLNLDPKYYYRIKESGWSWAYSNQKDDQGVLLTEDGKVASTEVNTHNPIIIVNTPKDDTPKHAESVVNNSFLTHQAVTTSSKDHTYTTVPGSGTTNP